LIDQVGCRFFVECKDQDTRGGTVESVDGKESLADLISHLLQEDGILFGHLWGSVDQPPSRFVHRHQPTILMQNLDRSDRPATLPLLRISLGLSWFHDPAAPLVHLGRGIPERLANQSGGDRRSWLAGFLASQGNGAGKPSGGNDPKGPQLDGLHEVDPST
jgi:hypothetical protein